MSEKNVLKNIFKKGKGRETKVGVSSSVEDGKDKESEAKAGSLRAENPRDQEAVVLISSAEVACPSGSHVDGGTILGKRGRAATYPGATSSSTSDSKPPPQVRWKVDARVRKRIPFTSEDDSKEDSNQEKGSENVKDGDKRLDRQARRENREKKIAEMEANAAKSEEKNTDPTDILNRCPTKEECRQLEVHKLGDIVREMISEVDTLRGKSKNLQGMVSGRMKECLERSVCILQNIVDRAQDRGNMEYLRAQNVEFTSKLRVAISNEEKFRREIDTLNKVALLKAGAGWG